MLHFFVSFFITLFSRFYGNVVCVYVCVCLSRPTYSNQFNFFFKLLTNLL